jgi:cell division protein FtsB
VSILAIYKKPEIGTWDALEEKDRIIAGLRASNEAIRKENDRLHDTIELLEKENAMLCASRKRWKLVNVSSMGKVSLCSAPRDE